MVTPNSSTWICNVCNYEHEGSEPPELCPTCGAESEAFEQDQKGEVDSISQPKCKWLCKLCGYIHEAENPPEVCPVCGADAEEFEKCDEDSGTANPPSQDYLSEWEKSDDSFEQKFSRMVDLAKHGKSEITPMRTQKSFIDWDSILFKGAQLFRMPLNEDEAVSTTTIIGKTAKHPVEIAMPFYVSHMSFEIGRAHV